MSDRRGASEGLAVKVPVYSLAGLFASGQLGLADEAAIEELANIRQSVSRMVVPSRGWMSPRYSDSNDRPVPRGLARSGPWKRYKRFFRRNSDYAMIPTRSYPWGLTWASVALMMITEAITFEEMARRLKLHPTTLMENFVKMIREYGRGDGRGSSPMSDPLLQAPDRRRPRQGKGSAPRHKKRLQGA